MQDTIELVIGLIDKAASEKLRLRRGRPTLLDEKRFTAPELRDIYSRLKSVRLTAEKLGISPTTVKKYIKGYAKKPGRNMVPQSWKASNRTIVHKWFVRHKNATLPRTAEALALMSGITTSTIIRYLGIRRKAVSDYLASLPSPTDFFNIYIDTENRKVPSTLIKTYTMEIDRFTLDVRLNCLLTSPGTRTIVLSLAEYIRIMSRE